MFDVKEGLGDTPNPRNGKKSHLFLYDGRFSPESMPEGGLEHLYRKYTGREAEWLPDTDGDKRLLLIEEINASLEPIGGAFLPIFAHGDIFPILEGIEPAKEGVSELAGFIYYPYFGNLEETRRELISEIGEYREYLDKAFDVITKKIRDGSDIDADGRGAERAYHNLMQTIGKTDKEPDKDQLLKDGKAYVKYVSEYLEVPVVWDVSKILHKLERGEIPVKEAAASIAFSVSRVNDLKLPFKVEKSEKPELTKQEQPIRFRKITSPGGRGE